MSKTAAEILTECHALGIVLQARGGCLDIDAPAGELTDDLLQQLRDAKTELLAILASGQVGGALGDHEHSHAQAGPSVMAGDRAQSPVLPGGDPLGTDGPQGDAGQAQEADSETTIRCPWCSSRSLLEGPSGLWCGDCERLAWEPADTGGLVRCDVAGLETIGIPTPCPSCGGIVFWWDVAEGAHCATCSPAPGNGQRLQQRAVELRWRHPVARESLRDRRSRQSAGTAGNRITKNGKNLLIAPQINPYETVAGCGLGRMTAGRHALGPERQVTDEADPRTAETD